MMKPPVAFYETNGNERYMFEIDSENRQCVHLIPFNIVNSNQFLCPLNKITIISGEFYTFQYEKLSIYLNNKRTLMIRSYYQPECRGNFPPYHKCLWGQDLEKILNEDEKVVVFTNDEHIFNGLRISIKEGKTNHTNVKFLHIGKEDIINPLIDKHGRINNWPVGFFDQSSKEYDKLL